MFGREAGTGIAPFDRWVAPGMTQEPSRSASRVFRIVDNGSSHRGAKARDRLRTPGPNLVLVHTPVHASGLNPIEIYFSIVPRKVLTPNDFTSLAEVEERWLGFQARYEQIATPFQEKFKRQDLERLMSKLRKLSKAA